MTPSKHANAITHSTFHTSSICCFPQTILSCSIPPPMSDPLADRTCSGCKVSQPISQFQSLQGNKITKKCLVCRTINTAQRHIPRGESSTGLAPHPHGQPPTSTDGQPRLCTRCSQFKPLAEFRSAHRPGLMRMCSLCREKNNRDHRRTRSRPGATVTPSSPSPDIPALLLATEEATSPLASAPEWPELDPALEEAMLLPVSSEIPSLDPPIQKAMRPFPSSSNVLYHSNAFNLLREMQPTIAPARPEAPPRVATPEPRNPWDHIWEDELDAEARKKQL